MAFETAAERLAYLTEFGTGVTFEIGHVNWDSYAIQDNEFVEVQGIESRAPVLLARVADLYQPGELQNIEFRATTVLTTQGGYNIVEVQEDGTGMALVILERQ